MKSVIDNNPSLMSPKSFPKLMMVESKKKADDAGLVVLMTGFSKGIVVYSGSSIHRTGFYSSEWVMSMFYDFKGTVTLENDE
jgi:hypothetical protein